MIQHEVSYAYIKLRSVFLFLPQALADETNRYASARCQFAADSKWTPVTLEEMTAYFGIWFFMSIISIPEMKMYWSTNPLYGNLFIPRIMTRERFDKIAQYLHIADVTSNPPRNDPAHDKLAHVRPLLDHVLEKCRTSYK